MQTSSSTKGTAGLIIAVAAVIVMAVVFRIFFLIILGIGLVVTGILYLWHRFRPIREKDIENKRPLGLD